MTSPLNSLHTPTRERSTMRKSPRCCGLLYWQSSCPPLPTLKAMRQLSAPGKRMAPHQLRSPRSIPNSGCWRDAFLSIDGAVECVDQDLNLDELVAGPLGLVPVERRGQHLRMPVPVRGHTLTGFLQRFKSLAHFGFLSTEGSAPRCQREPCVHRFRPSTPFEHGAPSPAPRSLVQKKPALLRAFLSVPAAMSAAAEAEGYAGSTAIVAGTVIAILARGVVAIAPVVGSVVTVVPVVMAVPMPMTVARTDIG